jgi:hypothetical protein
MAWPVNNVSADGLAYKITSDAPTRTTGTGIASSRSMMSWPELVADMEIHDHQ